MPATRTSRRTRMSRLLTIGLELSTAVAALYGGIGLIADDAIGMPMDWLTHAPFSSSLLPGVFLLLIIALPMATAAVAELRGAPWAWRASMTAGVLQVGWILAQWLIIQRFSVQQPVMLAVGAVLAGLAWRSHRGARR